MTIKFQVEPLDACKAELIACLRASRADMPDDHEAAPFEVDEASYDAIHAAGELQIVTARQDGAMVGFHVCIIRPDLNHASTVHAYVAGYGLRQNVRSAAAFAELFQAAEASLKARSVQRVLCDTTPAFQMTPVFSDLGWRETSRTFTKNLGG